MEDFGMNEMLEMQRTLQDKYKDIWEQISPEIGYEHPSLEEFEIMREERFVTTALSQIVIS